MVLPALSWPDAGLVVLTLVTLWGPGSALLVVAGRRGWTIVAAAPLVTYGLASVGGPASAALGIPWSVWSLPCLTLLGALLVFAISRLVSNADPSSSSWHWSADVSVAACVAIASVIGFLAVTVGIKSLDALPQDWDAAFHANGIRWIVETGDSSLSGMTQVNWYNTDNSQYYPNAYHLVAASITMMTGQGVPSILNAGTSLTPGILAAGLATLVRASGGRAVTAGLSAIVIVGITAFYDLLWRGPLLPFAMGIALIPALLVVLLHYLRPSRWGGRLTVVVPLALSAAGMMGLHPGALITGALFAAALLSVRWLESPRSIPAEALSLVVAGAISLVAIVPHILGSLQSAAEASQDWPAVTDTPGALGEALLFGSANTSIQVWLSIALAVGLLTATRLGPLAWLLAPCTLFVVLFVLAASADTPLVEAVTRPWWNDSYRLIGIAALPLAIVAAHGLAQVSDLVRQAVEPLVSRLPLRDASLPVGAAAAALVLGGYLLVTGGSYLGRNEVRMQNNTGNGPAVSREELIGFGELGRIVPSGERVLNDRGDGSAWMYAMAGVLPVAGHYYGNGVDPDATLLAERFHDYDTDPAVQAAVRRLNVHWVVIDRGFLRPGAERQSGLTDLGRVRELRPVYANPDMILYRLDVR